jgi:uncharacterized protein YndB with AHSA1/START domain
VQAKVKKPRREVFDAVADPKQLSRYFTTGGASGRLEEGATVYWKFADFPSEEGFPVRVKKVVPHELIVFEWDAVDEPDPKAPNQLPESLGYSTRVEMVFESLGPGTTLVKISESGWRESPKGLASSYGNCMGWTQMLCCLKAFLEHGINLREDFF